MHLLKRPRPKPARQRSWGCVGGPSAARSPAGQTPNDPCRPMGSARARQMPPATPRRRPFLWRPWSGAESRRCSRSPRGHGPGRLAPRASQHAIPTAALSPTWRAAPSPTSPASRPPGPGTRHRRAPTRPSSRELHRPRHATPPCSRAAGAPTCSPRRRNRAHALLTPDLAPTPARAPQQEEKPLHSDWPLPSMSAHERRSRSTRARGAARSRAARALRRRRASRQPHL
mmetsp:Transcript_122813/g.355029  ORF Transcript_122813/g.355029 Transcript_122813/m.355029 type:complete len:229 (+) Transcript_122813:58-744(+)